MLTLLTIMALALAPASARAMPGSLDLNFGTQGRVTTPASLGTFSWLEADVQIAKGPDGTTVAAVGKTVFRYLPDGNLDPSFGEGSKLTIADPKGLPFSLNDLAVDAEGRIFLIGSVEIPDIEVPISYISSTHPKLAAVIRYSRAGQLDSSFGENGFLLTDFGQPHYGPVYDKAFTSASRGVVDRDGDLIVIGSVGEIVPDLVRSHFEAFRRLIVRITPEGEFDSSFGVNGVVSEPELSDISGLALGADDKLLATGREKAQGDEPPSDALTRLRPDGSADTTFGRGGIRGLRIVGPTTLAVDRSGRILVLAGRSLLCLTSRGKPNPHFGRQGSTSLSLPSDSSLSSIVVEPSGRILLAGTQAIGKPGSQPRGVYDYRRSFTVIRLNRRGKPDRDFGHDGWVATRFGQRSSALGTEAFIDDSGRLVVGGPVARPDLAPTGGFALARYRLTD